MTVHIDSKCNAVVDAAQLSGIVEIEPGQIRETTIASIDVNTVRGTDKSTSQYRLDCRCCWLADMIQ